MSAETSDGGGLRAYVTGGTGFVGSNIAKVFAERHGAMVHCPVHSFVPAAAAPHRVAPVDPTDPAGGGGDGRVAYSAAPVDLTDPAAAAAAGEAFEVWTDAGGEPVNMTATPSLASECAEVMWRIAADEAAEGIFHCCGSEPIGRVELAQLACDVFGLDPDLVTSGPPDPGCMAGAAIPRDTSLRVGRTADVLGYEPLGVKAQLERLRSERSAGALVH